MNFGFNDNLIHEKLDILINALDKKLSDNLTEVYADSKITYTFEEDATFIVIGMGADSNTYAKVSLTTECESYALSSGDGLRCALFIVKGETGKSIALTVQQSSTYNVHSYIRVYKIN